MQAVEQGNEPLADLELIYVGDPMCSWCWGFDPVLAALDRRYSFPLRVIVGGLRPGPNGEALDDRMRGFLLHHWEEVAARSGQPFDRHQLDREDWVYDTELPARAVASMRDAAPHETLRFFSRLQRAFYAEVIDITDPAVYPELVEDFDVDAGKFTDRLGDEASKRAAWTDFSEARRYGISGFPSLLVRDREDVAIVTRGYMAYDALEPPLTAWLDERAGITARGLVCDIGDDC